LSGGVEQSTAVSEEKTVASSSKTPNSEQDKTPGAKGSALPPGYGRIIRDEAGNVVRIEMATDEGDGGTGEMRDMDMESLEPKLDDAIAGQWVNGLGGSEKKGKSTDVVNGEHVNFVNFSFFFSFSPTFLLLLIFDKSHASVILGPEID
jgi:hypothetical protein